MPSTRPAGTQPAMISLAKSWPDRSEVNGRAQRRPAGRPDRGADRLELQAAGREGADRERHADDAVPAELLAFGGHPADRLRGGPGTWSAPAAPNEPVACRCPTPCVTLSVRRRAQPPIARPGARAGVPAGVADVVDGGAEHLADGLEAQCPDRRELVGRQRGSPGAAAPDLGHPRLGGRRKPLTGMAGCPRSPWPSWPGHRCCHTLPGHCEQAEVQLADRAVPVSHGRPVRLSRRPARPIPCFVAARSPARARPPPWSGTGPSRSLPGQPCARSRPSCA